MKYFLLSLMLLACSNVTAPADRKLLPKENYRELFSQIEKCSGLHGDVEKVNVYVSPLSELPPGHSGVFIPPNSIYVMDVWPRLLAHEFMHYDLNSTFLDPGASHPSHFFKDVCGDLTGDVSEPF